MKLRLNYDVADLLFRVLFSLIFIGLGLEHIFSDELIQNLMPDWLVDKRLASVIAGIVLLMGGCSLLVGCRVPQAAVVLGLFLIAVTVLIHGPALLHRPDGLPPDWEWLWDVYQRSNFFKNLCLLGVCIYLRHHKVGRFSVDAHRRQSGSPGRSSDTDRHTPDP